MTLVELVVTIGFLLIISTLCFPRESIEKYQINSFTKQLCSDIRYVRRANMIGDINTYIYYTENNGSIGYTLRTKGSNIKEVILPKNTRIEHNVNKIKFRADGSPDPRGGTIRIFSDNISKEITIVPISGRVLLKEGKYET